jgi:hypothetical protein
MHYEYLILFYFTQGPPQYNGYPDDVSADDFSVTELPQKKNAVVSDNINDINDIIFL